MEHWKGALSGRNTSEQGAKREMAGDDEGFRKGEAAMALGEVGSDGAKEARQRRRMGVPEGNEETQKKKTIAQDLVRTKDEGCAAQSAKWKWKVQARSSPLCSSDPVPPPLALAYQDQGSSWDRHARRRARQPHHHAFCTLLPKPTFPSVPSPVPTANTTMLGQHHHIAFSHGPSLPPLVMMCNCYQDASSVGSSGLLPPKGLTASIQHRQPCFDASRMPHTQSKNFRNAATEASGLTIYSCGISCGTASISNSTASKEHVSICSAATEASELKMSSCGPAPFSELIRSKEHVSTCSPSGCSKSQKSENSLALSHCRITTGNSPVVTVGTSCGSSAGAVTRHSICLPSSARVPRRRRKKKGVLLKLPVSEESQLAHLKVFEATVHPKSEDHQPASANDQASNKQFNCFNAYLPLPTYGGFVVPSYPEHPCATMPYFTPWIPPISYGTVGPLVPWLVPPTQSVVQELADITMEGRQGAAVPGSEMESDTRHRETLMETEETATRNVKDQEIQSRKHLKKARESSERLIKEHAQNLLRLGSRGTGDVVSKLKGIQKQYLFGRRRKAIIKRLETWATQANLLQV